MCVFWSDFLFFSNTCKNNGMEGVLGLGWFIGYMAELVAYLLQWLMHDLWFLMLQHLSFTAKRDIITFLKFFPIEYICWRFFFKYKAELWFIII